MQGGSVWRVDHFRLIKELGEGLSGRVYFARDQNSGAAVAIKILDMEDDEDLMEKVRALQNEQRFLSGLEHPHIIQFHAFSPKGKYVEHDQIKTVSYLVTELAHHGEIFDVLFHYGAFDYNTARYYIKQLISALNFLHQQNKAHRDVKPENILLDKDLRLKLADFGFATEVRPDQLSFTHLGTPSYMSPELAANEPYDSKKNDVWATGMVLFIFCSGRLPFNVTPSGCDRFFQLFKLDRQKFWEDQVKIPPYLNFPVVFQRLIDGMLELDFRKRLTLDEALASEWLSETCDEEKALRDMNNYYQKTQKIIKVKRREELREGSQMILENCRSSPAVSWFQDVDILEPEELLDHGVTFQSATPLAVLDELKHFLSDTTTVLRKEKGEVVISVNHSRGESSAKLIIENMGNDTFKLCLAKRSGSGWDLHELKRKIQKFFWNEI